MAAALTLGLAGCATGPATISDPTPVGLSQQLPQPLPEGVRLVGLEGGTVTALLGEPQLSRLESPAEYWRYDFGDCVVDVFLYADRRNTKPRVAYWEVRPMQAASFDESERCDELSSRLGHAPASQNASLTSE